MAQPYRRLPRLRSGKFEKQLSEDVLYWKRMKVVFCKAFY